MITKTEEWADFAVKVQEHIREYVVPQYGDYPDDMIDDWDVKSIKDQLVRYIARIGVGIRGDEEAKRDALKIAHYACYLYKKLC